MGLQKQVISNSIKIGIATLGSCGAAFILWKISPTITAYFSWQIIVSFIYVLLLVLSLWHNLPQGNRSPSFNMSLFRNIWKFAVGMSGITVSAIILTQLDKVILSKLLSMEMFGYYTLATVVAGGLSIALVGPIFNALFPRFSALVAMEDDAALKALYHQGSQLMAVLVLPVAAVMAFFSFDILLLWTGSVKTAEIASPIVSLIVTGTALNGIMHLPYTLQISHGWTSIGLRINTFFIILLVPAIYFMTRHYGAVGAATVWVALNSIYMVIGVPFTHRRILKGEMRRWFSEDVGPPLGAALVVTLIGRVLIKSPMTPLIALTSLAIVLLGSFVASVLVASEMRNWFFMQLSKFRQ